MKKTISILLTFVMVIVSMSTVAFATDNILFGFDTAIVADGKATIPVYLTAVPEGLSGISSISFKYSFDEKYLTYESTSDGVLKGMDICTAGIMMWFEGDEAKALQNADIGKEHPLFYVNFKINDTSEKFTVIKITYDKLTDYDLNPAISSHGDYKLIEGAVFLQNDSGTEENPGGGEAGSETPGGSESGSGSGSQQGGGLAPGGDSTGGGSSTSGGSGTGTTTPTTPTTPNGSSSSGLTGGSSTVSAPETKPNTSETSKAEKASEVFSDVDDHNWAAGFALDLYNRGIVSGDNQGRANLENKITREETAKLALLVNGIEPNAQLQIDAADASTVSEWAVSYMATAIDKGIFSGYEDGTIRPSARITREEMVAVIIKSLGIEINKDAELGFADSGIIDWSKAYVSKAVELGFVNGYEDNTFRPTNPITRAEAFAIFSRVLEYKAK